MASPFESDRERAEIIVDRLANARAKSTKDVISTIEQELGMVGMVGAFIYGDKTLGTEPGYGLTDTRRRDLMNYLNSKIGEKRKPQPTTSQPSPHQLSNGQLLQPIIQTSNGTRTKKEKSVLPPIAEGAGAIDRLEEIFTHYAKAGVLLDTNALVERLGDEGLKLPKNFDVATWREKACEAFKPKATINETPYTDKFKSGDDWPSIDDGWER